MWKFCKNKKYTIQDLNITGSSYSHAQRERFKIAFIDDEDFVYQSRLANLGFRINKYEDVQDLNMLSSYDIIISDIRGVGKSFNSEAEGAFLLHELKRTYPYKVYAAYTGSAFDVKINTYLSGIQVIKKDISIEEWSAAIDSLISDISNPKRVWKRMRSELLDIEVPLTDLMKLEDEFVFKVLNNESLADFPSGKIRSHLSQDAIKIISSTAAALFAKLLTA